MGLEFAGLRLGDMAVWNVTLNVRLLVRLSGLRVLGYGVRGFEISVRV